METSRERERTRGGAQSSQARVNLGNCFIREICSIQGTISVSFLLSNGSLTRTTEEGDWQQPFVDPIRRPGCGQAHIHNALNLKNP